MLVHGFVLAEVAMAQEGPKYKTQLKHEEGLTGAIIERGNSFIEAAVLMLRHAPALDHEQNAQASKLLTAMADEWNSETNKQRPLVKEDLGEMEKTLIELMNDTLYQGQKGFKKMKDELDNAENHVNWKKRKIMQTVTLEPEETVKPKEARSFLPEGDDEKKQTVDFDVNKIDAPTTWKFANELPERFKSDDTMRDLEEIAERENKARLSLIPEDRETALNEYETLLGYLMEKLKNRDSYVPTDDPRGRVVIRKENQELEDRASKIGEELKAEIIEEMKKPTIIRTETPITHMTSKQEIEWLGILPKHIKRFGEKPQWFSALAEWEQKYFQSKVQAWEDQKKDGIKNLGDYLGTVPTTIRRYPGAPNAYHTKVMIKNDEGERFELNKVRSGVLAPAKMKAKTSKEKKEKVEITIQNLEQLVADMLKERLSVIYDKAENQSEIPILLQTLYSPPVQPPGDYNNQALMKAYQHVKKVFEDEDSLKDFCTRHDIPIAEGHKLPNVRLMYSSRPVNSARGLSEFMLRASGSRQGYEGDSTLRNFTRIIKNAKQKAADSGQDIPQNIKIADAALTQLKKTRTFWNNFASIFTVMPGFKTFLGNKNAMTEVAALEQIIADQLGARIGSCVSGKDREEMVTEVSIAQMQFYAKYKRFPPPPHKKNYAERDEFMEMVAHQYLTGHGQKLAGENSAGCDGLKNIQDVFGKDLCNKIRDIAPKYGIVTSAFDPIKDVQKTAGINKLGADFLKKIKSGYQSLKEGKLFKASKQTQSAPDYLPTTNEPLIKPPISLYQQLHQKFSVPTQEPKSNSINLNDAPTTQELASLLSPELKEKYSKDFIELAKVEIKARSTTNSPGEREDAINEHYRLWDSLTYNEDIMTELVRNLGLNEQADGILNRFKEDLLPPEPVKGNDFTPGFKNKNKGTPYISTTKEPDSPENKKSLDDEKNRNNSSKRPKQ